MGKEDDTVISADDTVITVDDDTVIEPDVDDTSFTAPTVPAASSVDRAAGPTPVGEQNPAQNPAQIPTQPMRRLTDGRTDAPTPTIVFGLRLATGARYELTSAVIFGRAPRHAWTHADRTSRDGSDTDRASKDSVVQLVTVPSREGRVSSTHAEFRQLGDVVVVTDLRSTNGTRVTLASGAITQLAPGDSMAVGEGAVVDIGDGNRIEVLREKPRDASKDIAR